MLGELIPIVGTICFWGFVAAIILVPNYLRHRDRSQMQETLRIALEKGQPVPAELINAMQSNLTVRTVSTPERDLRRGIVLIAVALGVGLLGFGLWYGLMSVDETAAYISGACTAAAGAIPGLIGLAYLLLWAMKRGSPRA